MRGGWGLGLSLLVERFYYPAELYSDYSIEHQTATGTEIITLMDTPPEAMESPNRQKHAPLSPRMARV